MQICVALRKRLRMVVGMTFEKSEIETLKFAVSMYRRMALDQYVIAHNQDGDKARRDSDRFSKIISNAHKIEEKLDLFLATAIAKAEGRS